MSKRTPDPQLEHEPVLSERNTPMNKGKATPTRKEREAANRRPLVPSDREEARKKAKEQIRAEREKARVGLAAGDERYLTQRDRGPQRRWIRDVVDSRFNVGEFLIPMMFLVILTTIVPSPSFRSLAMIALWGYVIVSVIDAVFLGRRIRREITAVVGADRVERGIRWYAAMRAFQLRVLRLPRPRVKRFKPIDEFTGK